MLGSQRHGYSSGHRETGSRRKITDHEIVLEAWKPGCRDIATWAAAIEDAHTRVDSPGVLVEAILSAFPNPSESDDSPHPAAVEAYLEKMSVLVKARRDYALEKIMELQQELRIMSDVGFEELRRYMEDMDAGED